jgi:Domain of unknown function (DUF4873)
VTLIVIGRRPFPALDSAEPTVLPDAVDARFDSGSEAWTVTTAAGQRATARVVVDGRPSSNATIAAHGAPNYFRIPGRDTTRQTRYVLRCLRLMTETGATRMEAKRPIVLHRWRPQPVAVRFDLSGSEPDPDDIYDGPATITVNGRPLACRVRLTGYLNTIDGRYHWQGTAFAALPDGAQRSSRQITVSVAERACPARMAERTPWGTNMIVGVGDPPFAR